MYQLDNELIKKDMELKKIKDLLSKMFNASSIKEFLETQKELKNYTN